MTRWSRAVIGLAFVINLCSLHDGLAQTPSAGHGSEVQIYEKFRAWTTQQPSGGRDPSLLERLFHRSM